MPDILPDSRLQHYEGKVVRGQNPANPALGYMNWVPIFCAANCGTMCGYVPEENCSFACWLCIDCAEKYGEILNAYMMPDEVFWEEMRREEEARYRRQLGNELFDKIITHREG
jgi:hypothetical protein